MDQLANNTNFENDESEKNADKNAQQSNSVLNSNTKSIYPTNIFTINHASVVYINAGTSTLSIANKYGISLSRLMEFNELEETDILAYDQLVFLEKKLKKGASDFYQTTGKESLLTISQKEGVRLESLMEYNKLKKDAILQNGQKIYLRSAPTATTLPGKQPS
jgi:LysM repeat protein